MENVFLAAMELTTILNQCYPQPGFVYYKASVPRGQESHRSARTAAKGVESGVLAVRETGAGV